MDFEPIKVSSGDITASVVKYDADLVVPKDTNCPLSQSVLEFVLISDGKIQADITSVIF